MGPQSGKVAIITGITGQDGAYLAEFLLNKGYKVHGVKRRTSLSSNYRLKKLGLDAFGDRLQIHDGDMTDTMSLTKVIGKVRPDEIYNLAAQSHVAVSFDTPEYTANSDAVGPLRILESMRKLDLGDTTRFYQASTSELYGEVKETPQTENTPFHPRSPYGVAKAYAYWITINYREAYGMFASNGILFNHESPLRGEDFVTRKISKGLCEVKLGLRDRLLLGNLNAKRDWGHARDYVQMQWLILQHDQPDDFVIATGKQYSVREFVERAARVLDMKVTWQGEGKDEHGYDDTGRCVVAVSPEFYRPAEVETLMGDPSKAMSMLGWKPKHSFDDLVSEMVLSDLRDLQNNN